jgi:hypothetical protein
MTTTQTFAPGDKVIKRTEKDVHNHGYVMDIPAMQQKPGYLAVLFNRQVWIKPENLIHFDEWVAKQGRRSVQQKVEPLKKYRVAGSFSYYADGDEEREKVKSIDVEVTASSAQEAQQKVLEQYDIIYGEEPSWLVGYPSVECLEHVYAGPKIVDYWTKAR